jgi:hypothetical protein
MSEMMVLALFLAMHGHVVERVVIEDGYKVDNGTLNFHQIKKCTEIDREIEIELEEDEELEIEFLQE